ncbi:MAG: DUF3034 family protein [Candidatus Omnitrophica bacterium]|nr:DUF3034 family protein [Candidatus Omnitrophota bacterium]
MKKLIFVFVFAVLTVFTLSRNVLAGPPLTNLEGVGGIAFNPLAYLADSDSHIKIGESDAIGLPRFGAWYVNLDHVNVDWTSLGVAQTFFKRLELSYGHEIIAQSNTETKHKNNIGAKFLVLPENAFDSKFVPAVSVGSVVKHTANGPAGVDSTGEDYYLVATKSITLFPRPVLLSGGVVSTNSRVTGVFGYDDKRDVTGFGNVDVILTDKFVLGFEYKQGARFPTFKNADYWDAHIAFLANKNLSLVLAYVNAGDSKSTSTVGLGDGVVLSAQYAF